MILSPSLGGLLHQSIAVSVSEMYHAQVMVLIERYIQDGVDIPSDLVKLM